MFAKSLVWWLSDSETWFCEAPWVLKMQSSVDPHELQNVDERDVAYMTIAMDVAKKALAEEEVPVGSVFVERGTGKILGCAANETNKSRNATRHSELVGVDVVIETHGREALKGSTLYVTLEPCIMCAAALLQLGVTEVVFGALNTRFGGCGGVYSINDLCIPVRNSCGVQGQPLVGFLCRGGVLAEESVEMLKVFYASGNPRAPDEKRNRRLSSDPKGV